MNVLVNFNRWSSSGPILVFSVHKWHVIRAIPKYSQSSMATVETALDIYVPSLAWAYTVASVISSDRCKIKIKLVKSLIVKTAKYKF